MYSLTSISIEGFWNQIMLTVIFNVERYVGWSCLQNSLMLSSLPCFPTFCWSAIFISHYISNLDYTLYNHKMFITPQNKSVYLLKDSNQQKSPTHITQWHLQWFYQHMRIDWREVECKVPASVVGLTVIWKQRTLYLQCCGYPNNCSWVFESRRIVNHSKYAS